MKRSIQRSFINSDVKLDVNSDVDLEVKLKVNSEGNPDANPDVIPEVDLGIDSDAIKSNEKCNETSYTNCNLLLARKCQDHVKCAVETFWSPVTELWVHLKHLCMKMKLKLVFCCEMRSLCDWQTSGCHCRLQTEVALLCGGLHASVQHSASSHVVFAQCSGRGGSDSFVLKSSGPWHRRQNRHTSP